MTQEECEKEQKRIEKSQELKKQLLPYEDLISVTKFKQTQENIDSYKKLSYGPFPDLSIQVDGNKCIISGTNSGGKTLHSIVIGDEIGEESIFNKIQKIIQCLLQEDYEKLLRKIDKI